MEEFPNLLVPVHEELVEDVVDDVVVNGLLELLGEDGVVLVEDGEHLGKQGGTSCRRTEWLDSRMHRMPV